LIKVLNSNFERQAVLKDVINPNFFEEINGEKTLTFSAILDEKTSTYINENAVIELDDDYFDIAYFKKNQNEDGTLTIDVEAEHISYRLNDPEYDMKYFASTGAPATVLSAILSGTGFSVGAVEFSDNVTYSIQEKKSRRMMLMEFVALLGGEVDFDKMTVSILQHRGSQEPKLLTKGKNIKVVSKIFSKRETDENGNPLISYTCTPIMLPDAPLELGDEVLLIQKDLDIKEQLRIVRIGYNPYNPVEAEIELANFVSGLEDDIYRIETSTVVKEKVYNGCQIGPEEGFVCIKSDNKVKATMNATEGFKLEIGDGSGNVWTAVFRVVIEGGQALLELDGRQKVTSGGNIIFEAFRDTRGGLIKVYDKNGDLCASLGVEDGAANNVGGTLFLFNGGSHTSLKRVAASTFDVTDAGGVTVFDSNGRPRITMLAEDIDGQPHIYFYDETGQRREDITYGI